MHAIPLIVAFKCDQLAKAPSASIFRVNELGFENTVGNLCIMQPVFAEVKDELTLKAIYKY